MRFHSRVAHPAPARGERGGQRSVDTSVADADADHPDRIAIGEQRRQLAGQPLLQSGALIARRLVQGVGVGVPLARERRESRMFEDLRP